MSSFRRDDDLLLSFLLREGDKERPRPESDFWMIASFSASNLDCLDAIKRVRWYYKMTCNYTAVLFAISTPVATWGVRCLQDAKPGKV